MNFISTMHALITYNYHMYIHITSLNISKTFSRKHDVEITFEWINKPGACAFDFDPSAFHIPVLSHM